MAVCQKSRCIDNRGGLANGICQRTDYRMRSISILAILLLAATPAVAEQAPPQVCFTPGGKCTDLIVSEIAGARH